MSEIVMNPVFTAVSAATAGALTTAVNDAVTAAKLVSGYVVNSVQVSNVVSAVVDDQAILLVTAITYKVQTQP